MISLIDLLRIDKFLCELDTNAPVGFSLCSAENLLSFWQIYHSSSLFDVSVNILFNAMHRPFIGCFIIPRSYTRSEYTVNGYTSASRGNALLSFSSGLIPSHSN